MRFEFLLCVRALAPFLLWTAAASAATPALLEKALQPWMGERDAWAFTQQVREFDQRGVKEERVERYDPSKPDSARWTLVRLNGRTPTPAEAAAFVERKGRKRTSNRTIADYLDLENARVQEETATSVRFEVPLRSISHLVPVDKVSLLVTVDRRTREIEKVSAELREPLRIAFGIAQVTDMVFDLEIEHESGERASPAGPASARPSGEAQATLVKFGRRAEFSWSDFTRVGKPAKTTS